MLPRVFLGPVSVSITTLLINNVLCVFLIVPDVTSYEWGRTLKFNTIPWTQEIFNCFNHQFHIIAHLPFREMLEKIPANVIHT